MTQTLAYARPIAAKSSVTVADRRAALLSPNGEKSAVFIAMHSAFGDYDMLLTSWGGEHHISVGYDLLDNLISVERGHAHWKHADDHALLQTDDHSFALTFVKVAKTSSLCIRLGRIQLREMIAALSELEPNGTAWWRLV